jgi:hypothetical protein
VALRLLYLIFVRLTDWLVLLCACRKPHPCWLSGAVILVDDSPKTVTSIYGQAFDPIGSKRLRPGPQGCRGGE